MAVKQLPTLSPIPEPPNRLVGDQERFDTMTFNSLKAQEKMVNVDLNQTLIPKLNEFAVDVNASVDAAKASETSALASKNSASSSAGTAMTKAGEAAASAKAAKASETSALASKNAASSSATAAANAQKAAEAARDEAQDLANVGYASESHAGLAKVDGKTTRADAGGVITVKDVAIGGDLGDLASARGQIGNPAQEVLVTDFNDFTTSGVYWVKWNPDTAVNRPPFQGSNGLLFVWFFPEGLEGKPVVRQTLYRHGTAGVNDFQILTRSITSNVGKWGDWLWVLTSKNAGDGIKMVNDKFSVPEYEGATASTAGTSGLVPPATAGQHKMVLTGSGEYEPALLLIEGAVADSIAIKDFANAIETAPPANTERGLFLVDKNGNIMGGFDVIQRASDNAKWTQIFAKNSKGQFTTLSIDIKENGEGEVNST
ncbi:pyocin knob domain-containing protein, partial [uncultured Bilophila sp.]|uniref:pyocin knob domain-containing protein n=1 Tax=uncultured Bilophila sp. TaxID=529385 RepID=UPI00280AD72E